MKWDASFGRLAGDIVAFVDDSRTTIVTDVLSYFAITLPFDLSNKIQIMAPKNHFWTQFSLVCPMRGNM